MQALAAEFSRLRRKTPLQASAAALENSLLQPTPVLQRQECSALEGCGPLQPNS
jgi:hypothetical protein